MLKGLIIPQAMCLSDVLATETAQRLVSQGAGLYCLNNGTTLLALYKPANAFAKAVCVRDLAPEVTPCAA